MTDDFFGSSTAFKVVIVGSASVGKSSILRRLVQNVFTTDAAPTCGADFYTYSSPVNNTSVNLQIWDTAGQERFRSISRSYFRNAVGAVLVYDVTSLSSFDDLVMWLTDLQNLCMPNAYILLVGNKADREADRQVGAQRVKEFSERHRLQPVDTSALTGTGVREAFAVLAMELMTRVNSGQIGLARPPKQPVKPAHLASQEESRCC
jgi:small GTP-binding protein